MQNLEISEKIKRLRLEKGLTQKQLANNTGLNYNTIIKIESKSKITPSIKTLEKIAKSLDSNIDTFVSSGDMSFKVDIDKVKSRILRKFQQLDKKYNTHYDYSYERLVNFSMTRNLPVHRWFYFQEGYSPELVERVFKHLNIKKGNILDPFSGSGTTLLVSSILGLNSIGFEINPFSAFVIKVKNTKYSSNDKVNLLRYINQKINISKGAKKNLVIELKIINKLFSDTQLDEIASIKDFIAQVKEARIQDLMRFALLSILEKTSNYRKGGNGLKLRKQKSDKSILATFLQKLIDISEDIDTIDNSKSSIEIINDSCLNLNKYNHIRDIDVALYSPPYANCFDPFEVYKIELWLGEFVKNYDDLRQWRKRALTSNLNADLKKEIQESYLFPLLDELLNIIKKEKLWDKRIPDMLTRYFYDMYILFNSLHCSIKTGGYNVVVVGNSSYANLVFPTDILLSMLGEMTGFEIKEIIVARRNEASSQQYHKLGPFLDYMRESIIIMQKL